MHTEPPTKSTEFPALPWSPLRSRRRPMPGWLIWIFGGLVFLISAWVSSPGSRVTVRGRQVKALAQAKQIGLALRLYAADHNGNYPRAGQPEMLGAKPADANAAFAVLFPECITSEAIFWNPLSAYQTRKPDDEIDPHYTGHPVKTLEPGENSFAYVAGWSSEDDPRLPLVTDGTDGTGHYVTDPKKRGGVWSGKKAVVIHLDASASLENLRGPDGARYIPRNADPALSDSIRPARPSENLLDFSSYGPDVRLLDPAVGPRVH